MLKTKKLSNNVIKIVSDCNCYIVEGNILIDTSRKVFKDDLMQTIESIIPLASIKKVIFTHFHYDHTGNFNLFPNAEFYGSNKAIPLLESIETKTRLILDPEEAAKFNIKVKNISEDEKLKVLFDIMETPGHNISCICLYYKKDNVFFTGDTYFSEGCFGRTDLPYSEPEKMPESLNKVKEIMDKHSPIIAPGHDY